MFIVCHLPCVWHFLATFHVATIRFISQSKTYYNMIPAKTHAKGLTVKIERGCLNFQISESYWTHVTRSATRGRYGVITTLQWGNCRPCYCSSSWTRKCCTGYHWECEDGSHACSKMAQGTIKQVTRQTSTLRHEIKTAKQALKVNVLMTIL